MSGCGAHYYSRVGHLQCSVLRQYTAPELTVRSQSVAAAINHKCPLDAVQIAGDKGFFLAILIQEAADSTIHALTFKLLHACASGKYCPSQSNLFGMLQIDKAKCLCIRNSQDADTIFICTVRRPRFLGFHSRHLGTNDAATRTDPRLRFNVLADTVVQASEGRLLATVAHESPRIESVVAVVTSTF